MTCSRRCSGRRAVPAALAIWIATLGCGHRGAGSSGGASLATGAASAAAAARPLKVAVLPVDNLAGGQAPTRELQAELELRLARRVDVVTGAGLEQFLSRHRLRYTGGIDAEAARAARDELGVDAVLISTLQTYRASPPSLGLTLRLVATGEEPRILWIEHAVRAGDEKPGLLGLGLLETMRPVQDIVLGRLLASLDAYLAGRPPHGSGCSAGLYHRPKVRFRSALLDERRPLTVAVVPFLNRSSRRGAGDALALELVRQLARSGRYEVLEPGVVRDVLLRFRVIMPGGISLETTRLLVGALGVDLIVSGVVLDYADGPGAAGVKVRFTTTVLEGGSGEVVWNSTSANRGDDGVFFFGAGRVMTAGDLTCRMMTGVVERMVKSSRTDTPPRLGGFPGSAPRPRGDRPAPAPGQTGDHDG